MNFLFFFNRLVCMIVFDFGTKLLLAVVFILQFVFYYMKRRGPISF